MLSSERAIRMERDTERTKRSRLLRDFLRASLWSHDRRAAECQEQLHCGKLVRCCFNPPWRTCFLEVKRGVMVAAADLAGVNALLDVERLLFMLYVIASSYPRKLNATVSGCPVLTVSDWPHQPYHVSGRNVSRCYTCWLAHLRHA